MNLHYPGAALPIRCTFFYERPHAFLSVSSRGSRAESFHRVSNAAAVTVGTQESSASEPHGGARLPRKDLRHGARYLAHLLVRNDAADEPKGGGLCGTEGAPAEHELERAVPADDPRQMQKMDRWNETEIDFGITECGALTGNEHVAGNGERHAATARGAADGGNRRLAEIVLDLGQFDVEVIQQASH